MDALLGDREPQEEDISKLKYCKQTLEETLRLRPPVPSLAKIATEDCMFHQNASNTLTGEILGHKILKGTVLVSSIITPHWNEEIWPNAQSFIPERFSEEGKANKPRHAFAYYPFSAGSRNCIGQKFALQEATLVVALLLRSFHIVTNKDEKVIPQMDGTITPKGLKVKYIPREK